MKGKMKHWVQVSLLLSCMLVLAAIMTGCGGKSEVTLAEGKINVITTFYTLYDFASRIGGEKANVVNLVPSGVEPHDWTPKSRDLTQMGKAQLFVYNGAGLEGWVDEFLDGSKRENGLTVVTASDGIELLHAEEDEHEDEHGKEHAHGDLDVDPHVWVSPKSALKIAENVKNGFIAVDKANQAYYEANYETLRKQLVDLDAKFSSSLASAKQKEIVVSHQAFGYLCRDYGLTQMPVLGLSPDSEPTAQDLKRINQFVKEHQVKYIFFEELVSDKTANMLAKDAGISTLVLNPLEGLTKEQAKAGESYVSIMEKNLQNLLKALQ
ncbi:MAG: periplasmic solute binding protein [Paenibacillus sp.]|nr:periplasmic solute binding protein [Paenibacillus sp.]